MVNYALNENFDVWVIWERMCHKIDILTARLKDLGLVRWREWLITVSGGWFLSFHVSQSFWWLSFWRLSSSICKHCFSEHNLNVPPCLLEQFHLLTKCSNKFDFCYAFVMLIRRGYRNQIFATLTHFCRESGVMMTPKRRLSTLIFACLCLKKSFLIKCQLQWQ